MANKLLLKLLKKISVKLVIHFELKCFAILISLFLLSKNQFAFANCLPENVIHGEYLIRISSNADSSTTNKLSVNSLDQLDLKCINCKSFDPESKKQNATDKMLESNTEAFGFNSQKISSLVKTPKSKLLVGKLNEDELLKIKNNSRLLSIEQNCRVEPLSNQVIPNDTLFNQQWGLASIRAPDAWAVTQGSHKIVVAVSDTGVDYNHPDLRNQMWKNEIELNGASGIDDDGNGCIDDVFGCDVADADGDPFPGSLINSGHGTHVAGIIGASANNNVGVSGVAWNVRIMAVKGFYSTETSTTLSALIESIYYAVDNGADIVNCSWGARANTTQAELDVFEYAKQRGVSIVVAAGNGAVDASEYSPASIPSAITVGSYNSKNNLSSFSNYGSLVDLLAPGGDSDLTGGFVETITSTLPVAIGSYGGIQGTSMAAPHVSGALALMLTINPLLTDSDLVSIIKKASPQRSFASESGVTTTRNYVRLDLASLTQYTYKLTNCVGENCSLSGGFGGGPEGFSSALSYGMSAGCGVEAAIKSSRTNYSALHILVVLITLLLPILTRLFVFRI